MAKGYSKDLRERAVSMVEDGESRREVASLLDLAALDGGALTRGQQWAELEGLARSTNRATAERSPSTRRSNRRVACGFRCSAANAVTNSPGRI
jgi:hypothetical protein